MTVLYNCWWLAPKFPGISSLAARCRNSSRISPLKGERPPSIPHPCCLFLVQTLFQAFNYIHRGYTRIYKTLADVNRRQHYFFPLPNKPIVLDSFVSLLGIQRSDQAQLFGSFIYFSLNSFGQRAGPRICGRFLHSTIAA